MAFRDFFTFGKIVLDDFHELYDTDKISVLLNKRTTLSERLDLGVGNDMFIWRHADYILGIGFVGHHYSKLRVDLAYCDNWEDNGKAAMAWWEPVKTVFCKSKDDVSKAVTEMLEYVKKQTGGEEIANDEKRVS